VPADNPFVGRDGARPEVWAYGLRNPWRFWIDPETRTLIVGDVGSTSREEVNVVLAGQSGLNFGWPCFEGTLVFDSTASCAQPVAPAVEFPRDQNTCAIIGGVVARDPRIAVLAGRYVYGDLCSGKITVLTLEGTSVRASADLGVVVPVLTSFGVDGRGQMYVTSANGQVYRLDPKPAG
jgi:glucose/arabinose dehydrogenase